MKPLSYPPATDHINLAPDARGSPHPWDGYLTGPENELAMAAAQAMARGERDGISPLLVYGPSGVGKSRLLAGLVAEWLRRQPGHGSSTPGCANLCYSLFGGCCCSRPARLVGPANQFSLCRSICTRRY